MKVICISGKARHGKDYTAECLKKYLEGKGKKVLVTHYADLVKYVCKNMFGWNGEKNEHGRHLLQYVGTDVVRTQNPDYWVNFIVSILELFPHEWDYVLIPDCRFPNEIDRLKEEGYDVTHLRIVRPNFDSELTTKAQNHISETALDNASYDKLILNHGDSSFDFELEAFVSEMVSS